MRRSRILRVIVGVGLGGLLCIAIPLIAVLLYCEANINGSAFISENNLRNETDVITFITDKLQLGVSTEGDIQNFSVEAGIDADCGEIVSASPSTDTWIKTDSRFDAYISCTMPIQRHSFLYVRNYVLGRLNVCYYQPRLRIYILLENDVITDVVTELLFTGL